MAKKTKQVSHWQQNEANLERQTICETLENNYMPYAMSVIVSRAIPEIDGFKPSHRKLLYTMYKMGLLTGNRTKSANIVGQTMKLNPHGDQAIYETMVRLTRGNQALLHPYIDSKGNFGSHASSDMQYAAPRYTEAKLDRFCETLFGGIEKEVVDFVDNYDGTLEEPRLLPAAFPSVLVNSNQGIAVGMASSMASFNLKEVCEATIAYLDDPGVDVLEWMPAPDFSSGGELIYNPSQMRQIYETGRGSFKLRARYRVDAKQQLIEIYEIPYTVCVEQIIDDLAGLVKSGKVKDILDVRDETDLSGLKLTIDYRKSSDPDQLMQKLFHQTRLEDSFSCNFNLLINGSPRVLGVKAILGEWISFRRQCVERGLQYDLNRKQERLHLLRGLERILLDLDRAIQIIRETEKEADVVPNLCVGFDIDERQADFVAEIKLRHLNRQYILEKTKDIDALLADIASLQKTIGNTSRLHKLIAKELGQIADRFGQARRTLLVHEAEVEKVTQTDLIEDYRLKLFLTEHGYVKKLALTSLRSATDLKTKDDDRIVQSLEASNKQEVIFFSNQAKAYKLFAYELNDHKPSDLGEYGANLFDLEEGEQIVFLYLPFDYKGQLLAAFENGKVARFTVDSFETKTRRKKLLNAYGNKSPLVGLEVYREVEEGAEEGLYQSYFLTSNGQKQVLFDANLVPLMSSRQSQGVQVLTMKKGEKIEYFGHSSKLESSDREYYRIRKIPGRGFYLKEDSVQERQQSLVDLS